MDSFAMSFPGVDIHPKVLGRPIVGRQRQARCVLLMPDGFVAVSYKSDEQRVGPWARPRPAAWSIPAIGVDAIVNDLRIIDLGDSKAYETPKNIVGHIPRHGKSGRVQ